MALSKAFSSQVWARGVLPLRDIPVLRIGMSAQETGARLDHREQAGSDPVTFFGAKKDIHILGNALLTEVNT